MPISQKCQYGLRAILELAKRGSKVTAISEIAAAQDIPARFLEQILNQLRQGGFVESRRGPRGGYVLLLDPRGLPVARVIEFLEGPIRPARGAEADEDDGTSRSRCVFTRLWDRARSAMAKVYEETSIQDLVELEKSLVPEDAPSYII